MTQVFDNDEPFIYRLNDNGFGPSLLVKVNNKILRSNMLR